MKKIIYKLLLTADTRGRTINYKEFVGHKVFLTNPNPKQVGDKLKLKTFIKSVELFDEDTKTYRKQKV